MSTAHDYAVLLEHLASWGFVVMGPNGGQLGPGEELLIAAEWLMSQNDQPSSKFYRKLDTTKIGVVGHREGAGGALDAAILSGGLISSVVLISLPDRPWGSPEHEFDLRRLASPVFFVSGGFDLRTTALRQQYFFDQVPGSAAKASLKKMGRVELDRVAHAYITAWLRYTLEGDSLARSAFVGFPPEIDTNSAWENQAQKNLP